MIKPKHKKLTLNATTVRRLGEVDLADVGGGVNDVRISNRPKCTTDSLMETIC